MDYLNSGGVNITIFGKQYIRKSAVAKRKGMTTKDMLKQDRSVFSKYALVTFLTTWTSLCILVYF